MSDRPDLLVVDDDPQDRKLLATILERDGFGVATATNAAEARSQLLSRDFALQYITKVTFMRILDRARKIGVTGTWNRDGLRILARQNRHPLLPVRPIFVLDE